MRQLLIAVTLMAIAAGPTQAQEAPEAAPPPPNAEAAPPPPPPPEAMRGPREFHGRRAGRGDDRAPMAPSSAARFRVESGDMQIDVRCAEDEPMKACADIVFQLIEEAGRL